MKKIKKKNLMYATIFAVIYLAAFFIIITFFGHGPNYIYVAHWAARHLFFFAWIGAILFAVFGDRLSAVIVTAGCFFGIAAGQIIGDMIVSYNAAQAEQALIDGNYQLHYQLHSHPGWWIWILVLLTSLIGAFLIRFLRRRGGY
jgi:hypothetical protein